jgi:hypothetical protein
MRAAAHTPGGFGGVSQSVGRDFVDADKRMGVRYRAGGVTTLPDLRSSAMEDWELRQEPYRPGEEGGPEVQRGFKVNPLLDEPYVKPDKFDDSAHTWPKDDYEGEEEERRKEDDEQAKHYQAGGEVTKNYDQANKDLKLTPQEQQLYQLHLHNLWSDDGYTHPDGGRSTYYMTGHEVDGKHYALPGVAAGKLLEPDEAVAMALENGLDKYPAYNSREELEGRYAQIHPYMEKDAQDWNAVRSGPLQVAPDVETSGYSKGGKINIKSFKIKNRKNKNKRVPHFQQGGVTMPTDEQYQQLAKAGPTS